VIAPSQTSVLPRRIAASAVDLFLVGILWLLVLYRLAVRFQIGQRRPDGTPIYTELQLQAFAEIREGLNRGQVFGDYYYSLHGRGLVLGLLSLLIFSLIAWVLVPANTGWSVGHRAFGLVVTDKKGQKPPLDSYLRRYLVGIVDLFPYVIPGLLGWVIASRDENHQRLGDRSADTLVIEASADPLGEMPEVTPTLIRPKADENATTDRGIEEAVDAASPPPPVARPSGEADMVDLAQALAPHTAKKVDPQADYPVLDLEDTTAVPTIETITGAGGGMPEDFDVEEEFEIDADLDSDASAGAASGSGFVSSLTDHEASIKETEVEEQAETTAYAETWHFPEAQDAPVWTPEPSTGNGPKIPVSDTDAGDTEADVRVEASAEVSLEANDATPQPANDEVAAAATAGMGDPVWNEEWKAWLYWDAEGKKWLRHDGDSGWIPIGDSQKA